MPLTPGSSRSVISRNISEMEHSGHPHNVAVAAALSNARRHPQKRAMGGLVHYDDGGGVTDVQHAAEMQNPLYRGQYERYAGMPPEKLRELSVMLGPGSEQGKVVQQVLQQKQMQPVSTGAPGAAGSMGYADGGGIMSPGMADPWWTRREASGVNAGASGFLRSSIPGRTDHIPTTAPAGSYVVPADVVSGLGEGNSLAGAKIMQEILRSGPYGVPLPRGGGRYSGPRGTPKMPQQAKGGHVKDGHEAEPTKILAAGGEFIIHPRDVQRIGGGSMKRGHSILDAWVVHERKKVTKKMSSLPGPKK